MNYPASIVIPNYNGSRHLPALLQALADQSHRHFELIFVDDASSDSSITLVETAQTRLGLATTLIRNQTNRGFAAVCNQGIAAAQGKWIVLLNNDTQPAAQWLEQLLACGECAPDVGMVASKMLFAHDPTQINSAGIAIDWMGIAWDWRGGETDDPHETIVQEIFGPCGGAALYSKRMLNEIGGLDEDVFMYMEDVDLAWRARLAGWRCLYQPQARVLHAHSASLGDASPRKSFLLGRNKLWLLAKNYPNPWLARYLPLIVAYDGLATVYGALRRRNIALLHGRLAGLRGLPAMLAKRQAIHRRWRHVENVTSMMSPILWPWQVSKRYSHLQTKK